MIPDEGRGFVFCLMVMLSAFQVVEKAFSTALLAATNSMWLLFWLSADMLLFFVYKTLSQDLIHYMPLEGFVKYVSTFLFRLITKVLADYAGILSMRNPYGMFRRVHIKMKSSATKICALVIEILFSKKLLIRSTRSQQD